MTDFQTKLLETFKVFAKLCSDNNLKYYAAYGTCLGAIRHHGFIPWDDDLDISLLRPDYDKFIAVAKQEMQEPFCVLDNYTGLPSQYGEGTLRVLSFSKVCHKGTSCIVNWHDFIHPQGIMLDVFPLDIMSDGSAEQDFYCATLNELYGTVLKPPNFGEMLMNNTPTINPREVLLDLYNKPLKEAYYVWERNAAAIYERLQPRYVGMFLSIRSYGKQPLPREWVQEVEYVPFETVSLPVPKQYLKILTKRYGDWTVCKSSSKTHWSHTSENRSMDIPYQEYMAMVKPIGEK